MKKNKMIRTILVAAKFSWFVVLPGRLSYYQLDIKLLKFDLINMKINNDK